MENDGRSFPCHLSLSLRAIGTSNLRLMTNAICPAETTQRSVICLLKHTFFCDEGEKLLWEVFVV